VPKEFFAEGIEPEIKDSVMHAVRLFERLGLKIIEVSLPHSHYGIAAYYLVATSEASSNLARYDGTHFTSVPPEYKGLIDLVSKTRSAGFGKEVKRRILLGTFALSSGYYDAYYLRDKRCAGKSARILTMPLRK